MEEQLNSTLETHRVAFFGGQGSRAVFSHERAATTTQRSRTAGKLLSACYNAFQQELSNAREQETGTNPVLMELVELTSAESLLSPPSTHHSNPIIQGVSLLVQQVLSYLGYVEDSAVSSEPKVSLQSILREWDEVMGFCSGVLPAFVVATSSSIEEFLRGCEHAVRMAFWIGYRVSIFCEEKAGAQWRARSWSIAVNGMEPDAVREYIIKQKDGLVCFSARISPDIITVTGTPSALDDFKTDLEVSADPIPVHGWYHGGESTESVVQALLRDVERRDISLTESKSFLVPVRSTVDGSLMTMGDETTLTETAVRIILTHSLDWYKTWESISLGATMTELHAFGPHSRSFFSANSKNTRVIDHSVPNSQRGPHEDIAIVGMSVNFPSAPDKETLWKNLESGVNTVQTIPSTRFNISDYTSSESLDKPTLRSTHGNFLTTPWSFDHAFFDISPRESRSMDPQQKLLLHATLHALDDAGYVPDSTPSSLRSSTGCYIGIATGDYTSNLSSSIDVYYSTGTLRAFLSGRLSYAFKFSGPSMVLDTACSASSIAIHQAVQALINGDCTTALAGGANVMVAPDMYVGLGRAHFLSPTGQCKAFDEGADGYCRAEGCGVFVLKRLRDAVTENDRIYGVIKGIAVNQSAEASSITRPHAETQARLFKKVLGKAGVGANEVDVVEAHGTGTQAGDAVEISSIQSVFGRESRSRETPLFITSIKGNIGHAEAASGAASLAKVLLMLRNQRIPKQIGLRTLNPRLAGLLSEKLQITTEGVEWNAPSRGRPRRAMINNFGAAGSNAAMVVEEAPWRQPAQRVERSAYPFVVSARTVKGLKTCVQDYVLFTKGRVDVADLCYTATARRRAYEHMVSVACRDVDDLRNKLSDPVSVRAPTERRPLVMVFSGQGGAYSGMGRELLGTCPVYRECVKRCERLLEEMGFPSIRGMLSGDTKPEDGGDTYLSQTASFVLQYALASVWQSWGVKPYAVIGHSLGEYAAMVTAGVMSLADGLRLVATRATLIADRCPQNQTGMMACNKSETGLLRLITEHKNLSHLQIACQNTMQDCVVAGPIPELQALGELCRQSGYKCKILAVPYGFHSSAMDLILDELRTATSSITYYQPKVRVGSTVSGDFMAGTVDSEYFVRQSSNTVRFAELLQAIGEDSGLPSAVFLEIGPSPITLPMIRTGIADAETYSYVGSLNSKAQAWETLSNALVELSSIYAEIKWRNVFNGTGAQLVDAPAYPLEQNEHFVPYEDTTVENPTESTRVRDTLLDTGLLSIKLLNQDVFETPVEYLAPYIQGHIVGGVALCPASIYHEMAMEAATLQGVGQDQTIAISNLAFDNPLVYSASPDDRVVQLRLGKDEPFRFSSYSPIQAEHSTVHCSGTLSLESIATTTKSFARKMAMIQRQLSHLRVRREHFDTFHTSILYETIFPRVVRYAPNYQTIRQITVADTGLEGYGTFKLPVVPQKCVLSPAFVDTLLHGVGFMANNYAASAEVYICIKVESARILVPEVDQTDTFSIYCSLLNCDDNVLIADSYALTSAGRLVAAVEGIHFKKLNLRAFHSHLSRYQNEIPANLDPDSTSDSSSPSSDTVSTGESPISTPPDTDDETTPIAPLVTRVISKICGVDLPPSTWNTASLTELGVDSLMAIEISAGLQKHLPLLHLDSSTIMEMKSITDLCHHIEQLSGPHQHTHSPVVRPTAARTRKEKPPSAPISQPTDNKNIITILSDVCGVPSPSIKPSQPLSAYGIDSLLSMEVRRAFKQKLRIDITDDQLTGHLTVSQLCELIHGLQKPTPRPPPQSTTKVVPGTGDENPVRPILLQQGDGQPDSTPLILFHDGSGSVAPYSKLKRVPFPIYGIASPRLSLTDTEPKLTTLKELAAKYAVAIRAMFNGDVIIGGWSFGGVLAYEISHHLPSQVQGVILIDSPAPVNHIPLPEAVIEGILRDLDAGSRVVLMRQFTAHAAMLGSYKPQPEARKRDSKAGVDIPFVMLQSEQTLNTTKMCGVEYPWLESKEAQRESLEGWRGLVRGGLKVLSIPGNHFEPFKLQTVARVTERLVEAYEYVRRV